MAPDQTQNASPAEAVREFLAAECPQLLEALSERGESYRLHQMSARDMFREYCIWNGLPGWSDTLLKVIAAAVKATGGGIDDV